MKLAVLKETRPHEKRVAASPETVKKFIGIGIDVAVESGAGVAASFTDEAYQAAGATIAESAAAAAKGAKLVLKVQRPQLGTDGAPDELAILDAGSVLIGALAPLQNRADVDAYAKAGITTFGMELVPRITRAQSMDILSSQANLAGYRAVLDAAAEFGRGMPMMMTAAGTIAPARVFVMGAGVAGLQAIATARRLGAVVSANDVRPAVKEQVESLGATFVAVIDDEFKQAETTAGYAKPMSAEYQAKQAALTAETIKKQDIIITTALIPGRAAPVLVTEEMVKSMKPGSVIVDLAVEQGGNCPLSEFGKVVVKHGVTLVGHANFPSRIATDASSLYARNLFNFIGLLVDKDSKELKIDLADDIIKGTLVTLDGKIVHPALAPAPATAA